MITWDLASGWTLELARTPARAADAAAVPAELTAPPGVPASVPGCVHTDLMAAGLIPDPLMERNEMLVQWIGECDWRYRCRFTVPAALLAMERMALHCEGLDTVATLSLNGEAIGRAENMHRAHRFDVTGMLREGDNELVIAFRSALAYAREQAERLGERPRSYPLPYNFVRKMACNFGWDWGPTLVTAGVWKPVRLEGWEATRIRQVRPWVRVTMSPDGGVERALHGRVEVHVDLERSGEPSQLRLKARLTGRDGDPVAIVSEANVCAHDEVVALALEVPSPRLWWPAGYGEQPLYDLTVTIQRGADETAGALDTRQLVVGFRDVALDTAPDAAGAVFAFVVNGRRIFAKGADWIPDDPFPARIDAARLRRRLGQAVAAGMNMVRVWGGGLYESDAFYDACDALGLLVWQDFAFACAAYPEEEPFGSEVEAEARANVVRLAPHPSLALWNGNNECLWLHDDNDWEDRLDGLSWGRRFYLQQLPRFVASLDPTRPYWAGSPWSGREELHPNLDGYGCKHIWDAWNERDYEAYRDKRPRFVAEFGYQAPPTWATLTGAISDRPLAPDSPAMLHHQKQEGGNAKLEARLAERFRVPADLDGWLFASQLNQARALELGVRHFRALAPHCMGTLVWQLNDCWPVTSWSAIDAGGRPKLSWFALRRAYAPVLLSIEPGDAGPALVLHNDSDRSWRGAVRVRRIAFDGSELAAATLELMAAPRSPAVWLTLPKELTAPADPDRELVVADADGLRALHFFAPDKDLRYPPPELSAELGEDTPTGSAGGVHRYRLLVHAHSLLRDLCVFPDRLHPDATVDDALVTLLPGESHAFTILSPAPLTRAALSAPHVMATANALVVRTQTA